MSETAHQRRHDLVELLIVNPDGLTPSQLSAELGVTRQTIQKDLGRLVTEGVYKIEGTNRYCISSKDYLRPMRLSLPHTWLLYLLLRRLVRANLHQDSQFRSLLYKLAAALHEDIADYLVPPDSESLQRSPTSDIWSDVVRAWHDQTYVELRYQALRKRDVSRLTIAPWWFEPTPWTDGFYLIGELRSKHGDDIPITLKLNRIQSVRITADRFQRPDPQALIASVETTWGIWGGDEPQEVVLRFHHRQRQRLFESYWHRHQEIVDKGDWLIWRAPVAEPQEMLPWIRGWGADVEVLAPPSLRDEMIGEARALARLYGVNTSDDTMFDDIFGA